MFRLCSSVAAVVLLAGIAGCGNYKEAESVVQDLIQTLNDASTALESVQDAQTAQAAASKLDDAREELVKLQKRDEEAKVTESQRDELVEKYQSKVEAALIRLGSAMTEAAAKSEGEPTLQAASDRFMQAFQDFSEE